MSRPRLRDLGRTIGVIPTGPRNTISDVAGVSVGHATVWADEPRTVRTGVTIVETRPDGEHEQLCYGGYHSFNGNGELTGAHWLRESGLLLGPLAITNTHQVGLVRDVLVAVQVERIPDAAWCLPVVGETYDGFLSDINAFALTADHVRAALADAAANAASGTVAEGCVGGGTGMMCHRFKGGIGTSSRVVDSAGGTYTVGALVQANYGKRHLLRLEGDPIGQRIDASVVPEPHEAPTDDTGSIIVILATDAPLLADQCTRLAQRATVGMARVGGVGSNTSGDLFLAFATGNRIPLDATEAFAVRTLPADAMTPLFEAAAEAVEEAIWNALVTAETTVGFRGRTAHAIPHELLRVPTR